MHRQKIHLLKCGKHFWVLIRGLDASSRQQTAIMVYHCTLTTDQCEMVCDCPLLPLGDPGDVVDEAVAFFRANILFRSYQIASSADKLLLYITVYLTACLQRERRGRGAGVCISACRGAPSPGPK